jgi:isopenicillin N synthase-like dioxygenase
MPAETIPDANAIPVIDLGPYLAGEPGALDHAAAELRHALTEIGFYTIVNHGVPSALVHEVYRQVARFHAQPLGEKLKIKLDKHNVGYLPIMGDTLRTSVVGARHQAQYERGVGGSSQTPVERRGGPDLFL